MKTVVVRGSETIVPGEKVTIDTGLIGYTVSGLPTGLKYDKTTGLITGSASKPSAAEGAVVKFTKKGFETEELTIVVTAIPKVMVGMEGVNSPGDTDGCKVADFGSLSFGLQFAAPLGDLRARSAPNLWRCSQIGYRAACFLV